MARYAKFLGLPAKVVVTPRESKRTIIYVKILVPSITKSDVPIWERLIAERIDEIRLPYQ